MRSKICISPRIVAMSGSQAVNSNEILSICLLYAESLSVLHTFAFCNFRHLSIIKPRIAMHARVRQVSVHAVNLCQIFASALWTHVHFKLLMPAVIAVCKRQIDTLIKAHFHRTPHQRFNCRNIIINRIFLSRQSAV